MSLNRHQFFLHVVAAAARLILIAVILPLIPAIIFQYPLLPTLVLIGGGFVIEYGAAPIGIALGLSPVFIIYVLICTETGIFMGLYEIFDSIGSTWPRVAAFLEDVRRFSHEHPYFERYGILGLIPCEIIVGVYANAPVSWIFNWGKYRALAVTMTGYIPSLVLTVIASFGILNVYFPELLDL